MNVSEIFSSRDKIEKAENHNPDDDVLQPIKRLFMNPNFTALYKRMNELERKINQKENKFLFGRSYKRSSFSIGTSPKHAMISKLLKQIQHTTDPVKKSQIRLVVDIFTDESSKAALKKLNLDKVDVNVDKSLSKKGIDTSTSLLRKEAAPVFSKKVARVDTEDRSEDPDASHFRRRNNYTPPPTDLEVAGNDDITTSERPKAPMLATNVDSLKVKARQLKRNRTRTHITGPFPMLFDTWEKLENEIDPLPLRKLDKYENNSQRSLQETIGTADNEDNQNGHSKSIITLDNNLLNPDNTVELAESKDKISQSKSSAKDKILDDMFVSDVDGHGNNDHTDVSSYGSDDSIKSFLEIGTDEDSQTRSKIRRSKNHDRTQSNGETPKSPEAYGLTSNSVSEKLPEIKVAIKLIDPTKPLNGEDQFNIVSMESKKNLGPRMNNDSLEQSAAYIETNEDDKNVDKSTLNMEANERNEIEKKETKETKQTDSSNQDNVVQQKAPSEADMKETPGVTGSKEAATSLPSDNVQFSEPSKPTTKKKHRRRRRKHKRHHVREHEDPLESESLESNENFEEQNKKHEITDGEAVGVTHHKAHKQKHKKVAKQAVAEAETEERTPMKIDNPLGGLIPSISVNKTLLIEAKKRFTENIYKTLSRFIPLEFHPSSESRLNEDDSSDNDANLALPYNTDLHPVNEQDNILSENDMSTEEESKRQKVRSAKHRRKSSMPKPSSKDEEQTDFEIVSDDDKFQRKVNWLKEELARLSPSHNRPLARRHDGNSRKVSVVDSKTKTHPINTWYFDSLFTSMYGDLKKKLKKLKHMKNNKKVSERSIKKMVSTIDKEIEELSEKADSHASQALIKEPTHTAGQIGELELGPVIDYFDYVDTKRQDKKKQHKHMKTTGKHFSPLKGKHMVIGSDESRAKGKEMQVEDAVDKETVKEPKNEKVFESVNSIEEAPEPTASVEQADTTGANDTASLTTSAPPLNLTYSVSGASIASSALTDTNSSYITPYNYPVSPAAYPQPQAAYNPDAMNNPNGYQNQIPTNSFTDNSGPQPEVETTTDSENRDSGPMSTAKAAKQNAASKPAKTVKAAAIQTSGQVTTVKPSELSDPIASKIAAALTNTQLPPGHPGNSEVLGDDRIRDEAMSSLDSERDAHITAEAMSYLNTDGMIDQHPPFDQIVSIGTNKDDSEEDPYLYSNHDAVIDFNYLNDTNYPKQPYAYSNSHATIDFPKGKRSVKEVEKDEAKTRESKVTDNSKTVKMDKVLLQFSKMFPPSMDPFAELEKKLSKHGDIEKN